jgi:ABC-type transport system involved in multi-copper enzyme maturation permease subunit
MLGGPLFEFELLTTPRKKRFYAVRAAYALLILFVFWQIHAIWYAGTDGVMTTRQMASFAYSIFASVALAQMVLILVLIPALVAGAIADEKQRKTLHYLLTSRLSGAEIVLGKLLARMIHVLVFLAVGLPILSLMHLFGGVDYRLILVTLGVTASTAFFLAAISIVASTLARRVRDALFLAYLVELLWLVGLPVLDLILPRFTLPAPLSFLDSAFEWGYRTNPIYLLNLRAILAGAPSIVVSDILWMIVLQSVCGVVLVTFAAMRLRSVFRAQEGGPRRRLWSILRARHSWNLVPRPPCRSRPMTWKELYTSRRSILVRLASLMAASVLGVLVGYYTYWYAEPAFQELMANGYPVSRSWRLVRARMEFHWFLQPVIPLLYVAAILGMAGAAAASVTSEREGDTWTSLTATDLNAWEIIWSKMQGAAWSARGIGPAILVLALSGVGTGSLDPVGFAAVLVGICVFTWFTVALGIRVSLWANSTWRAQTLTLSLLFLFNLTGQGIMNCFPSHRVPLFPGFMPLQLGRMLVFPGFVGTLAEFPWPMSFRPEDIDDGPVWTVILSLLTLVAYTIGAFLLTRSALRAFEVAAGRPRRSRTFLVQQTAGAHEFEAVQPAEPVTVS